MVTKPARYYAPALLERILACMRPKHPSPCFSGYISLETRYSLEVIACALQDLCDKGLIHRITLEEKESMGLRKEFDLYVLTELGYKTSNKEVILR